MFSNWLTSASASASASTSAIVPSLLQPNTLPPDVILEIGPLPFTRFAAHSTILVAHSGYMRSVLRPDERIPECPIYVPNITADHFTPLLTYMYTGFLDLTIENIFGVLLATHVLHMPRALEICRNFLTRIQPDGYGSHGLFGKIPAQLTRSSGNGIENGSDSVKIIRPIASKATTTGLAFVAPPISKPFLHSHDTPFRSPNLSELPDKSKLCEMNGENVEKIDIEDQNNSPTASTSQVVDVDRISPDAEESVIVEERLIAKKPVRFRKRPHNKFKSSSSDHAKSPKEGCSVVESPTIGIVQPDSDDGEKIIIDIASCDGPVRFQRVLNSAYGRYPLKKTAIDMKTDHTTNPQSEDKRANVANSFHLQMARNISERQSMEAERVDSENSEENIGHIQRNKYSKVEQMKFKNCLDATTSAKADGEVYNCVYCKHTFKSQYCYQKHAKRHINPLSIDGGGGAGGVGGVSTGAGGCSMDSDRDDKSENSSSTANANVLSTSSSPIPSNQSSSHKREVRPLDMNVQYYPCKTCGSKFPSYYFVHKHRKLCHANEEN